MKNNFFLETNIFNQKRLYRIKEQLDKIEGTNNFYFDAEYDIEIDKIEDAISMLIIYDNKNYCYNNIIFDILDDLERENNHFILKFSDDNILEVINRDKITKKFEDNIFKYFKGREKYYDKVQQALFIYKQLILENDYFERLLNLDTPFSYIFLNITGNFFYFDKKTVINSKIGNIFDELIPIIFEFNIEEINQQEIKLNFNLKLDSKNVIKHILISKIKKFYNFEMNKEFKFDISEQGYYILNKKNNYIKEIYSERRLVLDTDISNRKIIIKNIQEKDKR
ncbi:hypothetical protein QU666_05390 [Leptotrichia sp. HMT-225]|uniref:hypothetical protein n=1 Tax=Leptotrichia sp. HMT-225 TaxID=3058373 RepID=UPI00272A0247|nr:hypothetical protein [Leptotrichia sp. HMT-225]WLD75303.1 hypothetical protein QU666_05390 [Leptotrichia sp. HMT-225]